MTEGLPRPQDILGFAMDVDRQKDEDKMDALMDFDSLMKTHVHKPYIKPRTDAGWSIQCGFCLRVWREGAEEENHDDSCRVKRLRDYIKES